MSTHTRRAPSGGKTKPRTAAYYRRTGTGKGRGMFSIKCRQCMRPHRFSKPDIITRKPKHQGVRVVLHTEGVAEMNNDAQVILALTVLTATLLYFGNDTMHIQSGYYCKGEKNCKDMALIWRQCPKIEATDEVPSWVGDNDIKQTQDLNIRIESDR